MDKIVEVDSVRTTDIIAAEITTIRDQTKRLVLVASVEIGRRLCEAKEMLHHGEWGNWLTDRVQYSQSTANNLMRIYREYGDEQIKLGAEQSISQTFANLDYSQAVALFALPADEREDFLDTRDIEDTSVRELKKQIEEYKIQLDAEKEERDRAESDYSAEIERIRAELRETEEKIAAARETGGAEAEKTAKKLAEKIETQKSAIEKMKAAQEKQKAAAEKLKTERDEMEKKIIDARREADTHRVAAEKIQTDMDTAVRERVDAAVAKVKADTAKLAARADPDIAVFRVLFDAAVDSINRLRGMVAKAEGDKRDKMAALLRTLSDKITEGLDE